MRFSNFYFYVIGFVVATSARSDFKSYFHERVLAQERARVERGFWGGLLEGLTPSPRTLSNTFKQKINHFDDSDTRTFEQRFYWDSSLAAGLNSPVIFYICGEATCTGREIKSGAVRQYATKLRAHLVALEHRYYGKSQPFPLLSTENLAYLTAENAVEDLAHFQRWMMESQGWKGPWLTVGGSYPGSLSAYYRLKHPELVRGALASSAPVRAKADFEEYDEDVTRVAGETCAKKMREVVSKIEGALQDPAELKMIKELFNASTLQRDFDFLYVVADMASIAIQYGKRDEFCQAIESSDDALKSYAAVGLRMFEWFEITPEMDSTQGAKSLNPEDYEVSFGIRQWWYQTCSQFGYFQVAHQNPELSTRSAKITLEENLKACDEIFGTHPVLDQNATNKTFYEPLFDVETKNIFYTNGSTDPWSKLSVTRELGNDVNSGTPSFTIQGAAHCKDLSSPSLGDSESLKTARNLTLDYYKTWLGN